LNKNLLIRPFEVDDLEDIENMKKKYFETNVKLPSRQEMLEVARSSPDNFLVAEYLGRVVGCIFADPSLGHQISLVVVEEEFRRKGIATKLLGRLEEVLISKVISQILTNPYEKIAMEFFEKNGYKKHAIGLMKKYLYRT